MNWPLTILDASIIAALFAGYLQYQIIKDQRKIIKSQDKQIEYLRAAIDEHECGYQDATIPIGFYQEHASSGPKPIPEFECPYCGTDKRENNQNDVFG